MAKEFLIAGNWKTNLTVHEGSIFVHKLQQELRAYRDVEVVIAPSLLHLQPLSQQIDRRKLRLASQNGYQKDSGAFTGEVSFAQLYRMVHYSIIGHSERRLYFGETLEIVRDKVAAALRSDISPIICIGETQQERRDHETKLVLHDQLITALAHVTSSDLSRVVIAYEPVWAISTFGGELAKPQEVARVFKYIRQQLTALYGARAAQEVRILYGGSVDDQVARSYLEIEGCSGALVGGASLSVPKFTGIVEVARVLARERHGEN